MYQAFETRSLFWYVDKIIFIYFHWKSVNILQQMKQNKTFESIFKFYKYKCIKDET